MKIARLEFLVLNVSEKTNWTFIRLTADDGTTGLGESSLNGWEAAQKACAEELGVRLIGKSPDQFASALSVFPHSPGGLIASSIASAVEQAVTDLRAKRAGVPLHALLGKPALQAVQVYANINRGARDRTPSGVAHAAREAVKAGFTAIKIAPFDGVYWGDADKDALERKIATGIARIFSIREAVGPEIKVMVDCHWRFDEALTLRLLSEIRDARLYWLECPISENPDRFSALRRVRENANALGIRLAGAERQIGESGFAPYIEERLLDTVMPDVKYAGGYGEMLKIAGACKRHDIGFAPHNPTGPVCNLASMHLCAVAPSFLILEHQLAESDLYFEAVRGFRPRLLNGCFEIPSAPGLGVELDDAVFRAHPYRPLDPHANLDPRLG